MSDSSAAPLTLAENHFRTGLASKAPFGPLPFGPLPFGPLDDSMFVFAKLCVRFVTAAVGARLSELKTLNNI
jgi:hypothetical protein